MRLIFALIALASLAVTPAVAAPTRYALSTDASTVAFETDFGTGENAGKITGQMPISQADLILDFVTVSNSQVAVTLDVDGARASFPFATEALKGPSVLDARAHPQLVFKSTSVAGTVSAARVRGNVTLRGVTRPIELQAEIWRRQGSAEGDLSRLTVRLTGALNRSDFGATGFADMVADEVRIVIMARIAEQD